MPMMVLEREIDRVQFNCASRREVTKGISSVAITNPMSNVEFANNNSLFDVRMGAFRNVKCATCKGGAVDCPGHHGHIPLVEPCINPQFTKTTLKKILSLYCFGCFQRECTCIPSDAETDESRAPAAKRRKKTSDSRSAVKMVQVSDNKDKKLCGRKVAFKWAKGGDDSDISIKVLYLLISQVARNEYLNDFPELKHLDSLTEAVFIHDLIVLPTCCRPPNNMDGVWKADGISRLYHSILKHNLNLQLKRFLVPSPLVEEYHNTLQSSIDILFDTNNTNTKLKQHVKQNGGLRQRIDRKEGRLRLNLMGKRVEFSARTVLSGDPRLAFNEVGIPVSVAENLTIPVKVNRYNLREIYGYKLKYLFKKDGKRFDVKVSNNYRIEIGDTVERCLVNGDIVAINRQPTLHRGSILACYVKIFPCSTFRLNYSTMITLNADTDGDEINLHVPQDLESRAELEGLMLASQNIVCSQAHKPLVGLTQDSLLGCYKLSKDFISEHDFMSILYEMGIDNGFENCPPCVLKPQKLYSGNRVLSKALEAVGVTLRSYEPNEDFAMRDNVVIRGVMNKAIVGTADDSIIHHIYLTKGHEAAGKFIHLMQTAASAYLDMVGFSVGVSDCIVDHDPINFDRLDAHLRQRGGNWTDKDEGELCDALSELTKLPAKSVEGNRLLDMIRSGSKGSMMNFNQITNVVGQQIEAEGRVSRRFNDGTRTLPHFTKYDRGAGSRGLVKNSFLKGLKPHEFFMHAMGGRVGLIDTACKTATTGDQYRRLVKSLEPLVVKDVGNGERMVVNSVTGEVVQFNYGESGFDGTFLKTTPC